MPKIAPTREIAPFCSKNEEKYTKDGLDAKKDAKRDAKSSFCCSATTMKYRLGSSQLF